MENYISKLLGFNNAALPYLSGLQMRGTDKRLTSRYNQTSQCSIAGRYIAAIDSVQAGKAFVCEGDEFFASEYHSPTHNGVISVYMDKQSNKMKACFTPDSNPENHEPYIPAKHGYKACSLIVHAECMADSEYSENYDIFAEHWQENLVTPDENMKKAIYIISDNVYRRLVDPLCLHDYPSLKDATSPLEMLGPEQALQITSSEGEPMVLKIKNKTTETAETSESEPVSYIINPNREFDKIEQEMLKANTPSDSIIVSKEAKSIAKCCKETSEDILPARTFMLTGPAGTGKSTTAAMVAHLCGLPFVRQGLGPDTDKFDLLISTQPNTANCASSINELCEKSGLPTLSDLQFDAVGYYNEMTGKTAIEKDGCVVVDGQLISMEEFVYMATEKWINTVLPISNNANQQFAFVHSPIVEAAQKGWVVEIQEPTLVNNPGELGLLNSLLEEGVITLPNGEIIRRHPDNIVIFTTNYGYEGTGSLNQALRDRCRKEYRINLPAEPELVERVMARSGNTNKEQVTEMVRFVGHLKKLQKEQLVGDGEIGERSLIAWAADSIRNDPYESCIEDVINKAASDSDDVKFFIDALDNSAFKKTRKRKR